MKTKKEYRQSIDQHLNKVNSCGMMFLEAMTRCFSNGRDIDISKKEKVVSAIAYSVLVSDLDEKEIEILCRFTDAIKKQNLRKRMADIEDKNKGIA